MIEAIVINRLIKWAKWKMSSGVALGYPSQVSFMKLTPPGTDFADPRIEAECILTNRAVDLLPEVHKLVIRIEHIDAIPSMEQKAMVYGKSRRDYGRDRARAYLLLGNLLDALIDSDNKIREIA